MYKLEVTPVVGLPQFTGWSQVMTHPTGMGELVCAFAVAGEHAGNVGRDLMELIDDVQVSSASSLHAVLQQLTSMVDELGTDIYIACGWFTPESMILGVSGGSVFLKRESRTGVLLTSQNQIKIIEGHRQKDDVVVLSTTQASTFLSEVQLKFEAGFDLDSVITSIMPGVHGLDNSSLSSMAFVAGGKELQIEAADTKKSVAAEEAADTKKAANPEEALDVDEESDFDGSVNAPTVTETKTMLGENAAVATAEHGVESMSTADPNIPPALRLRGAGKKRQQSDSVELGDELAGLGELSSQGERTQKLASFTNRILVIAAKIKTGSVTFIKWMSSKVSFIARAFWQLVIATTNWLRKLPRKMTGGEVYLKSRSPRQLLRVIVPVILVVILIAGGIMFYIFRVRKQVRAAETALAPYKQTLQVAQETVTSDPIPAREAVASTISQLEQLETEYEGQRAAQKLVSEQLVAARQFYTDISGREEFNQLDVFYDLRLVESNFVTTTVGAYGNTAVFFDREQQHAIVLDLSSKQPTQISFEQLPTIKDIEVQDGELYGLGQGVYVQSLTGAELTEIIPEGDSNREGTLVEAFASYIYVLNPEKRDIYRYIEQDDGYSDPIGWVSGAAQLDYDQVTSWSIDGDIWIATRDGGIHRLSQGQEVEFEIVGLEQPLTSSVLVYTTDQLENVYVLEPDNNRLLVLSKEGEFLREITSASLASTTSLFVSEERGQAFAVSGSIIYSIKL